MIGTMYNQHSLPKAYGGYGSSYGGRSKKSNAGGVVTTVLFIVLVLGCGGLSLALLSSRAQLRDMAIHHEALSEDLTYTKNHLHHVEAQLASREVDYQHLAHELHDQQNNNHYAHELELVRQQKRTTDQALATANEEMRSLKHDLEATNALVEAYKQHLSDEVASHHQREENWLHIQEDWERLEKEMEDEINALRTQLQIAKLQIPASVKEHHNVPHHVPAESPRPHDPLLDNLPPAHVAGQPQQQQPAQPVPQQHQQAPQQQQHHHHHQQQQQAQPGHQQQQQQHVATPVPVPSPAQQAAQPQQQQQQQQQAPPTPAPVQQPAQAQAAPTPAPPSPAAHLGHDHYAFHLESNDHETHDWHPNWQEHDYDKYFAEHNAYADYPGWVDEVHVDAQHHHQATAQQHHDAHAQQHQDAHAQHHQQQQHHEQWHHQDDSHHFHQETQQHQHAQQQQGHEWDHAAGHGHEVYQAHHDDWHAAPAPAGRAHDDLSMKLGLGGGHAHHQDPHQQQHHR